ncbi:hypothetical protein BH18ACT6_BH18ACT6_24140 [soil metagenome]
MTTERKTRSVDGSHRPADPGHTDRGAALVEFALVLPILLLVLISIFEIGAAFRNYLTVSYLARKGARMSAFLGTHINADCTMVTSLEGLDLGSTSTKSRSPALNFSPAPADKALGPV